MVDGHLTIGELAKRTGVATSALRYYEKLGLLPAPVRVSGQRRYPESAVGLVGTILLLRDVGFSLGESKAVLASRPQAVDSWRSHTQRKLADLDEQIAKAQTAKEALTHALHCPHDDIAARLAGQPLEEAHPHGAPQQSRGGDRVRARPPSFLAPPSAACSRPRSSVANRMSNRAARRLPRAVGHAVAAVHVNQPRIDTSRQARSSPRAGQRG
jgi:DNA-binding transcriptional MerR regulator